MALNTGKAEERDGDYFGQALNRVARLLAAAHGGQTLISATTKAALEMLPERTELRDLGERRLKDLLRPERIFQVVTGDLPSDFPPLNTLDAVPNNLPTALTSFIGREREIADAKRLLSSTHLLTLTGAGGCGKTRLSLQVAADLLDSFPDGVWFVELAALTDPATVPSALASAMVIREDPARPILASIADRVRNKTVLLILDNCEHLVSACAEATDALLRSCPNLRIMASTREALGIAGETVWRVPSLPGDDAVRLFCDRARAVVPAFEMTEQNAAALRDVCQRLDGIPLAIELAAARVNVLHVDQIAARLKDRFRLLTGGSRTALPRQRTLRAAIDWSYDLLSQSERRALCRISIFAGGFTLEAAEAVCADAETTPENMLDLLSRLVEKSLVMVEKSEHEAYYSLLDMVRQYSRERLLESGDAELMGRRHRDYFLQFAEGIALELTGPNQGRWLDRIDREYENFRAALTWCQADPQGIEASLRLAAALSRFWFVRGYFEEARSWLKEAMSRADTTKRTAQWAKALRSMGTLALMQGDYVSARSLYEESLAIFHTFEDHGAVAATLLDLANTSRTQGNLTLAQAHSEEALKKFRDLGAARGIAQALILLGSLVHLHGDNQRAQALLEESLSIFRNLNLKDGIAQTLDALGVIASSRADYQTARSLHRESLSIYRELGAKTKIAGVLSNAGHAALCENDLASAESAFRESLQIAEGIGERRWIALALHNLGLTMQKRHDPKAARAYLLRALQIRAELGDKISMAYSLEAVAELDLEEKDIALAVRLFASADALRSSIGVPLEAAEQSAHDKLIASTRSELPPEEFEFHWAAGRSMELSDVICQALA